MQSLIGEASIPELDDFGGGQEAQWWLERALLLLAACARAAEACSGVPSVAAFVWSTVQLVLTSGPKVAERHKTITLVDLFLAAGVVVRECVPHLPQELCLKQVLPVAKDLSSLSQAAPKRALGITLLGSITGNRSVPSDIFVHSVLPSALTLCQDIEWEVRASAAQALAHIVPAAGRTSLAANAQAEFIQLLQDEDPRVVSAALQSTPSLLRSLPRLLRYGAVYPHICQVLERIALPPCMPFYARPFGGEMAAVHPPASPSMPVASTDSQLQSAYCLPGHLRAPLAFSTFSALVQRAQTDMQTNCLPSRAPLAFSISPQKPDEPDSGSPNEHARSETDTSVPHGQHAQQTSTQATHAVRVSQDTGALLVGYTVSPLNSSLQQPALPFPSGVAHAAYDNARRALPHTALVETARDAPLRRIAASAIVRVLLVAHRLGDAVCLSFAEFAAAQSATTALLHGTRSVSPSPKHRQFSPPPPLADLKLPPLKSSDTPMSPASRSVASGNAARGPLLKRGSSSTLLPAHSFSEKMSGALRGSPRDKAPHASSKQQTRNPMRPKALSLAHLDDSTATKRTQSFGSDSPKSVLGSSVPTTPTLSPHVELPVGTSDKSAAGPLLLAAHATVASCLRHPSEEVRLCGVQYVPALAQVTAAGVAHTTIAVYLQVASLDHSAQVRALAAQILPVWATQVLHGFLRHVGGAEDAKSAAVLMLNAVFAALADPCRRVQQTILRSCHVWLPCLAALKPRSVSDISGRDVLHALMPALRFALSSVAAAGGQSAEASSCEAGTDWRSATSCIAGLRQAVSLCSSGEAHDLLVDLTQQALSWQTCLDSFVDKHPSQTGLVSKSLSSSTASTPRHHDDASSSSNCSDSFSSISGLTPSASKSPRSLASTHAGNLAGALGSAAAAATASQQLLTAQGMAHLSVLSQPAGTLPAEPPPTFPAPSGSAAATSLVWLWRFAPMARCRQAAHAAILRGLAASRYARRRALLPVCMIVGLRLFSRRSVKMELIPLVLHQALNDHILTVRVSAFKHLLFSLACFTEAADTDVLARVGDAALKGLQEQIAALQTAAPAASYQKPSVRHLIMWQSAVASCILRFASAKAVILSLWARRQAEQAGSAKPPAPSTQLPNAGISVVTQTPHHGLPRHASLSAQTTPVARSKVVPQRKAATPTAASSAGSGIASTGLRRSVSAASAEPTRTILQLPSRRSPAMLKRRAPSVSTSAVRALRSGGQSAASPAGATLLDRLKSPSIGEEAKPSNGPLTSVTASAASVSHATPEDRILNSWRVMVATALASAPTQAWQRELPPAALQALQEFVPEASAALSAVHEASTSRSRGGSTSGSAREPHLRRPRRSSSATSAVLASDKFLDAEASRTAQHIRNVLCLDEGDVGAAAWVPALRRPFWPWSADWAPGDLLAGDGFLQPPKVALDAASSPDFRDRSAQNGSRSPSALLPKEHSAPPFAKFVAPIDESPEPLLVRGALASAACISTQPEEGIVLGRGAGAELKPAADRLVLRKGGTGSIRSLMSIASVESDLALASSHEPNDADSQWLPRIAHWAEESGADILCSANRVVASGKMSTTDTAAICSLPGAKQLGVFHGGIPLLGSAAHSAETEAARQQAEAILREAAIVEEAALRHVTVEGRRRIDLLKRQKDLPSLRSASSTVSGGSPLQGSVGSIIEFPPIRSASLSNP